MGGVKPIEVLIEIPEKGSFFVTGSELQIAVWKTLLKIPRGQVWNYSEVASAAGYPRAVRAVASAVGKNPIPINIPCHRVIRKNGDIGNYSYGSGVEMKKELLKAEGVCLKGL